MAMHNPLVSIVSGTYNRKPYLESMIASARNALPDGLSYEFVIIDGGSDDDTLPWLRVQEDVVLIEDGDLLGAINAFTRGAYKARGKYVLLANDDIAFHPRAIVSALLHLENNPNCGAVAFEDNRPTHPNDPKDRYKVLYHCAISPAGQEVMMPYAQVGLFRKWLGDLVGWWGANDEIMQYARKYGGDNFLSARIIEEGYTIEAVPGARCEDYVVNDALRIVDKQYGAGQHQDARKFRQRFPECPKMPMQPRHEAKHEPRDIRLLYLPIYEPGWDIQRFTKVGLRRALQKVGLVWEVDYMALPHIADGLPRMVEAWQPDILLMQLHAADPINAGVLEACRATWPYMKIINWHGDATRTVSDAYRALMQQVDLQLVVDAVGLDAYPTETRYWQIGYEEPHVVPDPASPHDVVFLGSCYNDQRKALEQLFARLENEGITTGLWGNGWQNAKGQNLYNFAAGHAIYQTAKLAIGDTFPGTRAFVSNRFVQCLAVGGALLLQQRTPAFEEHNPGLVEGEHYDGWDDLEELEKKIHYWLDGRREGKRARVAEQGRDIVVNQYSFDAQVRKLWFDILPDVFKAEL